MSKYTLITGNSNKIWIYKGIQNNINSTNTTNNNTNN